MYRRKLHNTIQELKVRPPCLLYHLSSSHLLRRETFECFVGFVLRWMENRDVKASRTCFAFPMAMATATLRYAGLDTTYMRTCALHILELLKGQSTVVMCLVNVYWPIRLRVVRRQARQESPLKERTTILPSTKCSALSQDKERYVDQCLKRRKSGHKNNLENGREISCWSLFEVNYSLLLQVFEEISGLVQSALDG